MMTAKSIQSLDRLYQSALNNNCRRPAEDAFVVSSLAYDNSLNDDKNRNLSKHLLVLSISSYLFRIITFFEFNKDAVTENYFRSNYISGNEDVLVSEHALLDAFSEFSNMVCGEVNRGLSSHFRHVGMSTPFFIAPGCLPFITTLNRSNIRSFQVCINNTIGFNITSCICADQSAHIDFHIGEAHFATVTTGDLELF